jgi:hypothetical protein
VRYVTHALVGVVVGVIVCAVITGAVHGFRTASQGKIDYDVEAMAERLKPINAIGAIVGAVAGLGVAAWKENR